jgi:hypothetical protein
MMGAWAKTIENTKPNKSVQHRVVARTSAEELREEQPQDPANGQPEITSNQANRHIARQAGLTGALPYQIVTQQPERQHEQPESG